MRLAEIPGLSGPSTVAVIHSSESVATLEAFFAARGIEARAVEAPDWVQIGTPYDGTAFAQPSPPPEPEPAPEPEPMPAPTPPTLEQVRSQLNWLREQALADYIDLWGEASQRIMWGLLATDLRAIAGVAVGDILPAAYPNLVGFLIGSSLKDPDENPISYPADTEEELTETQQAQRLAMRQQLIFTAANNLRHHQEQHMAFARRTEELRTKIIEEYFDLPDPEKLAWDAATAWAEGVAAWD